jgi:hypothetical protein
MALKDQTNHSKSNSLVMDSINVKVQTSDQSIMLQISLYETDKLVNETDTNVSETYNINKRLN